MLCRALKELVVVHNVPHRNQENNSHNVDFREGVYNVDLIIVRVTKCQNKPFGSAKPCIDCSHSLKDFNKENRNLKLRFIYYTDEDGVLRKDHINDLKSDHICYGSRLRKVIEKK